MDDISALLAILNEFFNSENPIQNKNVLDEFQNFDEIENENIQEPIISTNNSFLENKNTNFSVEQLVSDIFNPNKKEQDMTNNVSKTVKNISNNNFEFQKINKFEQNITDEPLQNLKILKNEHFQLPNFEKININKKDVVMPDILNNFQNNIYLSGKKDIDEIGIAFSEILKYASGNRSNSSGY